MNIHPPKLNKLRKKKKEKKHLISPHDLKTEPQKECDRLTHPLTDISSIIYRLRFLKFSLSENYTHFSVKN